MARADCAAEVGAGKVIARHRLGDRSCLALPLQLGVPALTADREWKQVKVKGLRIELIRS
jgi:PIN domain nuclease of toxin-antitoxin system